MFHAYFSPFLNYTISYIYADDLGNFNFHALLMQLCVVRDDRGWQRGLACRRSFDPTGPGQSTVFPQLRPNGASTRGQTIYSLVDSFSRTGPVAVVRRSLVLGKQSTVLWTASVERDPATRRRGAALFRLTRSAAQLRPNDAVPLRRCNSASSGRVRGAASLSMLWLGAAASTG